MNSCPNCGAYWCVMCGNNALPPVPPGVDRRFFEQSCGSQFVWCRCYQYVRYAYTDGRRLARSTCTYWLLMLPFTLLYPGWGLLMTALCAFEEAWHTCFGRDGYEGVSDAGFLAIPRLLGLLFFTPVFFLCFLFFIFVPGVVVIFCYGSCFYAIKRVAQD